MKAILVIDVDEEDIGREVNYISVKGGGMSYIVGAKDSQVLIRPLPQKKEHQDEIDYEYGYIDGWNDCIDAIISDTNGTKGGTE